MSQSGETTFSRGERGVTSALRILQNIGMCLLVALMLLTVVHSVGRYFFHFLLASHFRENLCMPSLKDLAIDKLNVLSISQKSQECNIQNFPMGNF